MRQPVRTIPRLVPCIEPLSMSGSYQAYQAGTHRFRKGNLIGIADVIELLEDIIEDEASRDAKIDEYLKQLRLPEEPKDAKS